VFRARNHMPSLTTPTLSNGSGTAILTVPAGLAPDGFTLSVEDGEDGSVRELRPDQTAARRRGARRAALFWQAGGGLRTLHGTA